MKLVITQLNVGGRLRFIPGGANGTSLHNYPRDGWITEAAARKWAKQNGHEIVKVEKMAGNGEKTFRIEYTYKDRNGRTKTSSPELVGTSVEPLKKRIIEGLERNGDKLLSFGKITSKDSVDYVDEIRQKYANDGFLNVDRETRRKIISYLKTRWKLDDAKTNRFIRDFDRDLGDLVKDKEPWDRITKFIDGRVKKIDVNPYSNSYGHSLIAQKYKKPGKDKLRSKDSVDAVDEIREKYANDVYSPILGKEFSGKGKDFDKALRDKRYEGLYKQIDFYLKHYAKQKKLSDVQMKDLKRLVNEIRSYGKNGERWVTEVKKTVKEFKDSCEDIENIREKYQSDAVGAGVVNPNFKFQTNVEKRLATTRKGRAMTLPQYGKPSKVIVKKDGNSFSVIGKDGQKLNKNTFKSYEEAEKWARGNGWMVERR